MAHQAPLSMKILQARILEWVAMPQPPILPTLEDIPSQGIEPRSPALQLDSLPTEPPGKSSGFLHRRPLFCTAQCIASSFQIAYHLLLYITIFISGSKSKIRIK